MTREKACVAASESERRSLVTSAIGLAASFFLCFFLWRRAQASATAWRSKPRYAPGLHMKRLDARIEAACPSWRETEPKAAFAHARSNASAHLHVDSASDKEGYWG